MKRISAFLRTRVTLPAWALLMLLIVGSYYYVEAVFLR